MKRLTARAIGLETASNVAVAVIEQLGLKLSGEKTQYLLLLGSQEIDRLAALAIDYSDVLIGEKKPAKGDKALQSAFLAALDGGEAVDLALFGRMIADKPDKNVDAAVQMAHAISTHAVATEFDFYSAVDELQREDADEGAGAGMLGTTLYNSACYYRYANLDLRQLTANLNGDSGRVSEAARAFLQGMIHAVPTGKQTASAAQNPPALILAVVRDHGLWSLANAFVKPVRVTGSGDLLAQSGEAMLQHFRQLAKLYGTDGLHYAGLATYLNFEAVPAPITAVDSIAELTVAVSGTLTATQQ